jgi:hypothetical protein
MSKKPDTVKVEMHLTEREFRLLKDMLYEEIQVGNFNQSHVARLVYDKLEATER